jgi:hypothetical protein
VPSPRASRMLTRLLIHSLSDKDETRFGGSVGNVYPDESPQHTEKDNTMRKTVYVKITQVERVGTSRNGNPTYRIYTTTGDTFLTETDGQIGYAATNYRPRRDEKFTPVKLTLIARNRVTDITREN